MTWVKSRRRGRNNPISNKNSARIDVTACWSQRVSKFVDPIPTKYSARSDVVTYSRGKAKFVGPFTAEFSKSQQ